ncbi:MAG: hypothetical protein IKB38_08140 [Clostridia bacterium]|nr:hypothetical protein [Clostridia bacterium]
MNTKDKRLIIFLISVFTLTAGACVMRVLALINHFDTVTNYFTKSGLIIAASVVICIATLVAISYLFLGKSNENLIPHFHGAATFIPSGLLALAVIFALRDFFSASAILAAATVIAAVCFVIYLFLNPFLGKCYSTLRGAFALAPIIFLLLFAVAIYTDTTLPINAPNKAVDLFAAVSATLFFTGEARLSLGREKWNLYTALGLISISLTAYSSVPAIIVYFVNGAELSLSIIQSVLIFALFVFSSSRVILTLFLSSDKEGALAAIISKETKQETEYSEDENQMSFDDLMGIGLDESENGK